MKLKQKWNGSNDYSWKWFFYFVITWKLLYEGVAGGGGGISRWEDGMSNFQLVEELPPSSPVGKTLLDVNKDSGTK